MPLAETQIRSEAVQDILTKVPNWTIRWGNTLIFALLLLFLGLSWLISYPDIIDAQAVVTTEVPPQKEYAQASGKLKHILVSNTQKVKELEDLAVIENTANYEDVTYLKSIIDTLTYSKERFDFPVNEIPLLFLGDIDVAYATFENAYLEYDHNRTFRPFNTKRASQSYTASESRVRLSTLEGQQSIQKKELQFQKSDLDRNQSLYDKGVISLQEFEQNKYSTFKQNAITRAWLLPSPSLRKQ